MFEIVVNGGRFVLAMGGLKTAGENGSRVSENRPILCLIAVSISLR